MRDPGKNRRENGMSGSRKTISWASLRFMTRSSVFPSRHPARHPITICVCKLLLQLFIQLCHLFQPISAYVQGRASGVCFWDYDGTATRLLLPSPAGESENMRMECSARSGYLNKLQHPARFAGRYHSASQIQIIFFPVGSIA